MSLKKGVLAFHCFALSTTFNYTDITDFIGMHSSIMQFLLTFHSYYVLNFFVSFLFSFCSLLPRNLCECSLLPGEGGRRRQQDPAQPSTVLLVALDQGSSRKWAWHHSQIWPRRLKRKNGQRVFGGFNDSRSHRPIYQEATHSNTPLYC